MEDSKEQMLGIIDAPVGAKRLEAFFAGAERRVRDLPAAKQACTISRSSRARGLTGGNEALQAFTHDWCETMDKLCPNSST